MKFFLASVLVLAWALMAADQRPTDVATAVIRSENLPRYVPMDGSEQELNRAAVFNSAFRLQEIMLHKVEDRELKICYALRILQWQISATRQMVARSGEPRGYVETLRELVRQQDELAREFRSLQK